jgi:uncharacterized membrane protein (DUF485 family)
MRDLRMIFHWSDRMYPSYYRLNRQFRVLSWVITLVFFGCDLFDNSMVDYFEDHTQAAVVTGVVGQTRTAVMADGTILIPPGATTIGVRLANPRNFSVRQDISNSTGAAGTLSARQTGPGWIEVAITGAAEGEDYTLTLRMQSPDGIRDFPPIP